MGAMSKPLPSEFRERLWPSPWLLIVLLLLIPAVMLTVTPLIPELALPIAIAAYVLIAGSLLLMAPSISVRDGVLHAGRASVPVAFTGQIEALDEGSLRRVIGPGADARAYLLVRGHIHRGLRIEITDAADPTPYWVMTTRKPQSLTAAIERARSAVG